MTDRLMKRRHQTKPKNRKIKATKGEKQQSNAGIEKDLQK